TLPASEGGNSGWQAEPELRDARLRFRADPAAGCFDQLFDDGQPDAGAAAGAVPGLLDPIEALEDVGQILLRDAVACVADADEDIAPPSLGRDRDQSAVRRVAGRVLEQIGEHLRQLVRLGAS